MSKMILGTWFLEGWEEFQAGRWFEAHEVWECGWRELDKGSEKKLWVQGLIQLAVSLEHWKRKNPRGALGQWQKGTAKLAGIKEVEGWPVERLILAMKLFYRQVGLEQAALAQLEGQVFFWAPVPPEIYENVRYHNASTSIV